MSRHVILYGVVGVALIALMRAIEYRFLMIEYSAEMYGALIAVIFVGLGIWLGRRLTVGATREPKSASHHELVAPEALKATGERGSSLTGQPPSDGPTTFAPNAARIAELGITPREQEILALIASGLSNREIADRVFISENTVKTHSSRLFEKLGARRRTQAVQLGKEFGILP